MQTKIEKKGWLMVCKVCSWIDTSHRSVAPFCMVTAKYREQRLREKISKYLAVYYATFFYHFQFFMAKALFQYCLQNSRDLILRMQDTEVWDYGAHFDSRRHHV